MYIHIYIERDVSLPFAFSFSLSLYIYMLAASSHLSDRNMRGAGFLLMRCTPKDQVAQSTAMYYIFIYIYIHVYTYIYGGGSLMQNSA